ncbi:MAG: hypothetical protein KZQ92_01460 [Candidatus Thiodiazotropha sp. (ex Lucinoma borealis)]|nr:hypothetical protein [Candidatus Thiodiazotropha sp. (ex Lucinoma borealis)]MCU7862624.1 hypothetical protein [Candidatus Thiodiazotropha sp. (ex Lucinoma borealis)]
MDSVPFSDSWSDIETRHHIVERTGHSDDHHQEVIANLPLVIASVIVVATAIRVFRIRLIASSRL